MRYRRVDRYCNCIKVNIGSAFSSPDPRKYSEQECDVVQKSSFEGRANPLLDVVLPSFGDAAWTRTQLCE